MSSVPSSRRVHPGKVWPRLRLLAVAAMAMAAGGAGIETTLPGQEPDAAGQPADAASRDPAVWQPPASLDEYMGRRIARTMHYEGAPWLIRDERELEERCSLVLANLGLRRGMSVCDMGCGNGFYSLPLAELVGDAGQVYAVDIQPEMLELLRERIERQGVANITPVLGSLWDPRLPAAELDLVLMVDVYHEFSHPVEMLAAIRRSLAPDGVVVLVEFRAEDDDVPIKPEHKMTRDQCDAEMQANGFRRVREFDQLPWQHMLVYGKEE